MARDLEDIKAEVMRLGDPWDLAGRTRLWDDGVYTGDGSDLIACRDIVHDLYILWSETGVSGRTTTDKKGTP